MTESEYPPVILEAIQEVMTAVPYIKKSGRNEFNRYNYASEADVLGAIRPAMLKAGLILVPSLLGQARVEQMTTQKGGVNNLAYVTVEYTLAHKSGAIWPEKLHTEGCGMDTQDKAVAKAITSAQKYFLLKFFQIETGDDPDKDQPIPKIEATEKGQERPAGKKKTAAPEISSAQFLEKAAEEGMAALGSAWITLAPMIRKHLGQLKERLKAEVLIREALEKDLADPSSNELATLGNTVLDWIDGKNFTEEIKADLHIALNEAQAQLEEARAK